MKFLIDAQLPAGLALWLQSEGYSAVHVRDVGLADADDSEIWSRALSAGEIVVTKDEDFATRASTTDTHPIIVWLRIGNATNRRLIEWIDPRWAGVCLLLELDQRLIEVR